MPKANPELQWLEKLQARAKELHADEAAAIKNIRDGFVPRAVVFMDVVGSTLFKIQYADRPETWILRVRQFSELLASAVESSNGRVVKFIGDEVMATFENAFDAQNLVGRIAEVEDTLYRATGFETRIKVAADWGNVYELTFAGHKAPDPQGTPVDRCARIAKFGLPGEVLASSSFVEKTPKLKWEKVGSTELKGLGKQLIYQLGRATADIEARIDVRQTDFDSLSEERSELRAQNARLTEQNKQLQQQLSEIGERPSPDACAVDEEADPTEAWKPVEKAIRDVKKVVRESTVPPNKYARFAFLYWADMGPDEYNKFEGRTFDELIEKGLVAHTDGGYTLNLDNLRNKRLLQLLKSLETALEVYLRTHEKDPDELFEWSLRDPEFWGKYIGFSVSH